MLFFSASQMQILFSLLDFFWNKSLLEMGYGNARFTADVQEKGYAQNQ